MERVNISSGNPYESVFGYSRAVRVGNQVHVSGTAAPAPHDTGDAYEQSIAILGVIRDALRQADADISDVVRTVIYVTNIDDKDAVAKAHREMFGDVMPAATLVAVSALARPSLIVEIEAYAVVGVGVSES